MEPPMLLAAVDPGITPNANFPFLESLKQIGGGILVGAFIVIAIVAIMGAAMLLAGKLSQSSRLASGGGMCSAGLGRHRKKRSTAVRIRPDRNYRYRPRHTL